MCPGAGGIQQGSKLGGQDEWFLGTDVGGEVTVTTGGTGSTSSQASEQPSSTNPNNTTGGESEPHNDESTTEEGRALGPCAGKKGSNLIYDSDKRTHRDGNTLQHITNRHIRKDINQTASKYIFGLRLQGSQTPDAIAEKQVAVLNINRITFNLEAQRSQKLRREGKMNQY